MAADYIIEQMEDEYRQAVHEENMREAAILIINGMSENDAVSDVENTQLCREDAKAKGEIIEDENGFVDSYLNSELDTPSSEGLNPKQIYAIQKKLLEKYS